MSSQVLPESTDRSEPGSRPDVSGAQSWFRRHRVAAFLAALFLSLAWAPFEEQFRDGELLESLRLTVVLLSALLALGTRRRTLGWALVPAVPALAAKWVNHWRPDLAPPPMFLVPAILFLGFVIAHLLYFIIRAQQVDSEVLCAGVATYLILGLLWALAYILLAYFNPGAFAFTPPAHVANHSMRGFTAVYFSFITLSTAGYGDIIPVSGSARMLAMMEITMGVFYTTVLIARLVTLYASPIATAEVGKARK